MFPLAFKIALTKARLLVTGQVTILGQYSVSIPPENVRKPEDFDISRGYRNGTLTRKGLKLKPTGT